MKILLVFEVILILQINESRILAARTMTNSTEVGMLKKGDIVWRNLDNESRSLLGLLKYVGDHCLQDCSTIVVLYDELFERNHPAFLNDLFKNLPFAYVKRRVYAALTMSNESKSFLNKLEENSCWNYLIFVENLNNIGNVVHRISVRKLVIVSSASSWTISDFLKGPVAKLYTNILMIAHSTSRTAKVRDNCVHKHKNACLIFFRNRKDLFCCSHTSCTAMGSGRVSLWFWPRGSWMVWRSLRPFFFRKNWKTDLTVIVFAWQLLINLHLPFDGNKVVFPTGAGE